MMAMFLPQVVSAAVVYWTGTTNNDWNTASNWTTGALPTSADDVYIHAGSTPDPVISSGTITVRSVQVRVRSLTVNSGATLRIIGDAGSAFAIFMMTDASSVVNNGTIALEASTGGPTTGWMIPGATTTFTNNGTLRINTTFQTAIEAGNNLNNEGQATGLCTINNSACGKIILTAGNFMIYANTVSNVTNAGLIQVTSNINGFGNFTNQSGGVLIRGGGSQAITSNNGSVIVNNNPTNSTIFTYTGTFTGTLNGIYTDSAGTTSAGTFTAPNTFSPSGLPTGAQTLYAKITPSGGACSYVVPFTYTMIAAPSITTQPTSGSTCAGSSRTFTVAASNAPTYQWQVSTGGSFTNLSNTSPYSNVTGASLNISNVAGLNGYQYRCIATNGGGSDTSNAAILTVNTAPAITTQPTAQTTCAGSSVSFSVAATGTGLSYQWKKGAANVGTNSATYTIASPVVGDAGNYSVVVSGTCGSPETSNSVALTVSTAPTITTQPAAQTTCAGSSVSFSVAATGTGLSYQWKKGTINLGTNSATYTIASPVVGDAGNYSVVVSGTCGSPETSNSVALTVNPFALRAYVNGDVASSGDGTSWATAVKTIEEGLNICGAEEVWVATGTYKPTKDPFGNASPSNPRDKTFYIKDGIEIYGGFAGTETLLSQRNITANITTLSGDFNGDDVVTGSGSTVSITNNTENAYCVVLASAPTSGGLGVTIDGFTIRGGNANGSSNLTVNGNSIFRTNGGGIHTYNGTNTLTNNTLSGNSANTYGGGFYIRNGTNTLTNNTLSGNSAHYGGGIVVYNGTNNTLTNNTLLGNSADLEGGGFYIRNGTNTLTNNTLSGNSANYGGGIYTDGGTNNYATLTNNTLSGNSANYGGGGIYTYDGTNTINNCIFWANTQGGNAAIAGSDILNSTANPATNTVTYCLTQLNSTYSTGTGIINNQNPLFVNAADIDGADNIHRTADDGLLLSTCSPAINVGTNTNAPTTDILGNAIYSSLKDMGAYELQANPSIVPAITTQPTAQTICAGSSVSFSVAATGTGLSYQWKKGATNVGTNSATYTIASPVVGDAGNYSVVVSGTCAPSLTSNIVLLNVNPAPNASITYPTTLCTGTSATSVQLSGSNTGTYSSIPAGLNIDTNTGTITPSSSALGVYTITYTIPANGNCTSFATTSTVNIATVPLAPSISASSNNVCAGTPVTLTASPAASYTSSEYLWYKNGTAINWGYSPTFTVGTTNAGTDIYSVEIVYLGYACISAQSASSTIIKNSPNATITPNGATTFCANNPTSLSVSTGMNSYIWKRGNTIVNIGSSTYIPTASGNHSVKVTDINGCSKTSPSVNININPLPIANAGADKSVCSGQSVQIGANNNTANSYTWSPAATLSNAATAYPIASPLGTTNYTLTVTDNTTGCSKTDIVVVTINSLPVTPAISSTIAGTNTILTVNSPGANAVNWYKNGLLYLGNQAANGNITMPISNTTYAYTCKSISANGCLSSFSNAINARQGNEKEGDLLIEINDNTMSVYPNPTNGDLNVEISYSQTTNGMLYLHNAIGQMVFSKNIELLNGFTREILDLQSLAAGIYTLTFQTDSGNIVHKIVKD